jgi:heavy metal sensor kinase
MKYHQTFRFRIDLQYGFVLVLLLSVFSTGVYLGFQNLFYSNLDGSLLSIAESELASSTDSRKVHFHDVEPNSFRVDPELRLHKLVQIIMYPEGELIGKNRNLGTMQLPLSPQARLNLDRGEVFFESVSLLGFAPIRMITLPVIMEGKIEHALQVGASLVPLQIMLTRLLWVLIIMSVTVLGLTGVAGMYLARQALRQVDRITDAIQGVVGQSLNQRLTIGSPNDEFSRLTFVLNQMLERLEGSFQSQQRFVADASHELRSPMATLQIALELALRRPRSQEEYRVSTQSALQDVERISGLINSLLLLSRADSGHLMMDREPLHLKPLLHQLVEQYQEKARANGITLECSLQDVIVLGDEPCLRQLVANLLDNAMRYTPEQGVISLAECLQNDTVQISVKDTGIGIPAEHLPHLFDRFYRVDKERSRQDGGSGLGLAICQAIVDFHDGELVVNSSIGEGSTFTVILPAYRPPALP